MPQAAALIILSIFCNPPSTYEYYFSLKNGSPKQPAGHLSSHTFFENSKKILNILEYFDHLKKFLIEIEKSFTMVYSLNVVTGYQMRL